jgi:hypothetical protein
MAFRKIFLYVNPDLAVLVPSDSPDTPIGLISKLPAYYFGETVIFCISLLDSDGNAVSYLASDTFEMSVDNNFLHNDDLMAHTEGKADGSDSKVNVPGDWADVSAANGKLSVRVDFNTVSYETKIGGSEFVQVRTELKKFDAGSEKPAILMQSLSMARNVVNGGEGEPTEADPNYLTAAQTRALAAAEAGNLWKTGSGTPTYSDEKEGDLYLDTGNGNVYQVESGAYVLRGNITGPQGDMPVISGGSATVLPPESMPTMDVRSAGSAYFVDFGIPEGKEGSLSAISEYSVSSAYAAMTCLTYQGGGYQVLSATSAGENPDTNPEKFVCFAKAAELQGASAVVSYLTSGRMAIPGCEPFPVALQTHAGKFYPVEKETVTRSSGNWYIDPAPYLAYDNVSAFAGSWTVYLAGGGAPGPQGDMPVLSAGSATVLPPGSSPSVDVISSGSAYYFDLGIPQGEKGDPPVLSGGTVSTLPPGTPASASVSSTGSGTYRMDLSIPSGSRGEKGDTGDLLTVKQFITPEDVTSSNTVVFPGEKTLLTLLAPGGNAYTVRDDDVRYTSSGTVLDMTRFLIGENISALASSGSWTVLLADAAVPVVVDGGTVSSGYQADYASGDVQKIKLAGSNADITLTASNIPLGKMMVLHVDNSAGANLIFRNNDLLVSSDTGKYMIGLANVTGSAFVYGTPVREIG